MSNRFLTDAILELINFNYLKKFLATRKAVKLNQLDLTTLTIETIKAKNYLNPWVFNLAEAFFASLLAVVIVYLGLYLRWGYVVFDVGVESVFAPFAILLYLIITSYVLAHSMISLHDLRDKAKRERCIVAILFSSGAYGFVPKLITSMISVFIMFVVLNGHHPVFRADIAWFGFGLLFISLPTFLVMLALIWEYYYLSSIVRLSGDMLKGIGVSNFRLKLVAAVMLFGPVVMVSYYLNIEIAAVLIAEIHPDRLIMPKIAFYSAVIFLLGCVFYGYLEEKVCIAKGAIITAFFVNIPSVSSTASLGDEPTCPPCPSFVIPEPFNLFGVYIGHFLGFRRLDGIVLLLGFGQMYMISVSLISCLFFVFTLFSKNIYKTKIV